MLLLLLIHPLNSRDPKAPLKPSITSIIPLFVILSLLRLYASLYLREVEELDKIISLRETEANRDREVGQNPQRRTGPRLLAFCSLVLSPFLLLSLMRVSVQSKIPHKVPHEDRVPL